MNKERTKREDPDFTEILPGFSLGFKEVVGNQRPDAARERWSDDVIERSRDRWSATKRCWDADDATNDDFENVIAESKGRTRERNPNENMGKD